MKNSTLGETIPILAVDAVVLKIVTRLAWKIFRIQLFAWALPAPVLHLELVVKELHGRMITLQLSLLFSYMHKGTSADSAIRPVIKILM